MTATTLVKALKFWMLCWMISDRPMPVVRYVAFPAISTGIYGYPKGEAAAVASEAIAAFLAEDDVIREVRLVFYAPSDARAFLAGQRFGEGE